MLELLVDGTAYGGWERVRVSRSIEQMAGAFEISVSEKWPSLDSRPGAPPLRVPQTGLKIGSTRPLKPGQSCSVQIGDQTVITGFIDAVNPSYTATDHLITLSGRDRTGDLVDCSATHRPGQWFDQKIETIAADLCAPFSIPVKATVDSGPPLPSFVIEPGQSVFAAIEHICRPAALLPVSDGQGGLILTRPGTTGCQTRLERGRNILSASASFSNAERFSEYTVEGQFSDFGDLFPDAESSAHVLANAKDKEIDRHRPLLISAEDVVDQDAAAERAAWEASVRAARSRQARITVQGWREQPDGPLWQPNCRVRLTDDWLGINDELLITGVTLSKDGGGTTTELTLMPPGVFASGPGKNPDWGTRRGGAPGPGKEA